MSEFDPINYTGYDEEDAALADEMAAFEDMADHFGQQFPLEVDE